MMNKKIFLFLIIFISTTKSQLNIQNGSFEGPTGPGITPAPWENCMQTIWAETPDTQPGFWGVVMPASEGNTYLGLAHDPVTAWQEGASQQLIDPMEEGVQYNCSVDLAGHIADLSDQPVELLIWGGFADCPQTELLWSSGDVPDFVWTTYAVQFTPSNDYTDIMLQINSLTSTGTYLLVDNFSCEEICPEPVANAGIDQDLTCEDFINLSANAAVSDPVGGQMIGQWTIISGGGVFNDLNDPNSLVSNLELGANIFEWTLTNDCGTSSDQVIINYNQEYNFELPSQVYCLSSFELLAGNIEGTWIVDDPLNMTINNPNTPNTVATPSIYGSFTFSFESCGSIVFIQEVDVLGVPPIITGDISSYCLDPISLNVDIIGDPGYWDYQGPGEATFNNILSLNPIINVDTYGTYVFTYYGCGMSSDISVNFFPEPPTIIYQPTIFCSLETTLEATSNNPGEWTLIESPINSTAQIQNPTSLITDIEVSDYGEYQFMFEGCGSYDIINILFETQPPIIISGEHDDCLLTTTLTASTEYEYGPIDFFELITTPTDTSTVLNYNPLLETENFIQSEVTVSGYGIYEFLVSACDTYSTVQVAFSCEPTFPNVFTPNGDGNNDFFVIKDLNNGNYSNSLLTIYNRWGEIVFLSTDYGLSDEENWWDGKTKFSTKQYSPISIERDQEASQIKMVSDGVYYYIFDVFNISHNQAEKFTGHLTILKIKNLFFL